MKIKTKKVILFCFIFDISLVIGLFFGINIFISTNFNTYIYKDIQTIPESYTAIVLGAQVYYNGSLSPMLADRVQTGIDLYKAGKVKKILFSGDHGRESYDEVNAMLKYAQDQEIPEQDIFTDHAGFDTYDSMYRARDVFQVSGAIIITQEFHLDRAIFIARSLGLEANGIIADRQEYVNISYQNFREYFANLKAFFDCYILHSTPKYLGEKIPITGDGRETRG